MKSKIFACATIVLIIFLVIYSTLRIENEVGRLIERVTAFDTSEEQALEKANELRDGFQKSSAFISLFVSHDDLTNIEELFAELIGRLKAQDAEEADVIKSRLINSLEHLKRLSGMNLEAII